MLVMKKEQQQQLLLVQAVSAMIWLVLVLAEYTSWKSVKKTIKFS